MKDPIKKDLKQFENTKLDKKQLEKVKGGGGGINEDIIII
jgi:hypothetical protein